MITDSITSVAGGHAPAIMPDAKSPPRTPTVDLVGIIPNKQFVLVAISDGRFNWQVECTAVDIQSFAKFQAVAVKQCGIWIQHASQEESRPVRRADDWNYAVTTAFNRGKAAVA